MTSAKGSAGKAPPDAPATAFGVDWAGVTGQWEGLLTSVGSSVGSLLPVPDPGSLAAAAGQRQIAAAPTEKRAAAGHKRAKKRTSTQGALPESSVLPTASQNGSEQAPGLAAQSHTDETLRPAEPAPVPHSVGKESANQRPQAREREKHRTILKEKAEDEAYARKPHRTSPVLITTKPTQSPKMSKLYLALTSSAEDADVDKEVSDARVGQHAALLRGLTQSSSHASTDVGSRFTSLGHEEWLVSRQLPGSGTVASRRRTTGRRALLSKPLDKSGAASPRGGAPSLEKAAAERSPDAEISGTVQSNSNPSQPLYPYTDAEYISQYDMYDGGLPPQARAPLHPDNVTLTFVVSNMSAENIPSSDKFGKSDAFIQARYGSIIRKTKFNKNVANCSWSETFEFVFPKRQADAIVEGGRNDSLHTSLAISLMDHDTFGSDFLGQADIDLREVLTLDEAGQDFTIQLIDHGELVTDNSGNTTLIRLHIAKMPNPHVGWVQPTLEETLASSHDDVTVSTTPLSPAKKRPKMVGGSGKGTVEPVMEDVHSKHGDDVDLDYYWREGLEKAMNSFSANLFVVCVVSSDIIVALAFLIRDETFQGGVVESKELFQDTEGLFNLTWNAAVNIIFVVEVTMRQLAMKGRFWGSIINVFDFVVVWLSVIAQGGYYVLEYLLTTYDQQTTAKGSSVESSMGFLANTGIVRILSKVVQIARIVRAFYTLRKARSVSGQVNYVIRAAVSQNKRRLYWNGFDLDLTYITDRIIAMSVPAFGQATAYRNNIHQVSRYFALRHYGRFFVFNLCDTYDSSDGIMGQYNTSMLYNKVHRVPFEDHSPPLMSELVYFCQEAATWMARHPENVVVVHCKGGKGRTGVMIAGLIMWTGHRKIALDALELFTFRRTSNYDPTKSLDGEEGEDSEEEVEDDSAAAGSCCGRIFKQLCCMNSAGGKPNQGVEGPSQLRYVNYLQAVLYNGIDPWALDQCIIEQIDFPSCSFMRKKVWSMSFTLRCQRVLFYDSFASAGSAQAISASGHNAVNFPMKLTLSGDVRIDFFYHKKISQRKRKLICFVTFNTNFCKGRESLLFKKNNVDMFHKDRRNKRVPADFKIGVNLSHSDEDGLRTFFSRVGQQKIMRRGEMVGSEETDGNALFYIDSGVLEGVVEQPREEFHQLGNCLPSDAGIGCSNDTRSCRRMPIMCLLGKGAVVGASQFLANNQGMAFRVRSAEARLLVLSRATEYNHTATRGSKQSVKLISPLSNSRKKSFFSRSMTMMTGSRGETSGLDVEDIMSSISAGAEEQLANDIPGVEADQLGTFYHGLAKALVPQLDRAQVEAIRILSLRAMNDAESLLSDKDIDENLRVSCARACKIPIHEKMCHILRCSLTTKNNKKIPLVRILVMDSHVVFDTEYYGPRVSKNSIVLPISKMINVHSLHRSKQNAFCLAVLDDTVPSDGGSGDLLESCPVESEYTLAFSTEVRAQRAFKIFHDICQRGRDKRNCLTNRVHRSSIIANFAKRCGKWHVLRKNEELVVIKTSPALFVVCKGTFVLKHKGMIYRIVEEGTSFGVENLVQRRAYFSYDAFAESNEAVILELRHSEVSKLTDQDKDDHGKFYHYICMLIESEYNDLLKSMFPGTWCEKTPLEQDHDRALRSPSVVRNAPLDLSASEAGPAAATADRAASQTHEVSCLHSAAGQTDVTEVPGDPPRPPPKGQLQSAPGREGGDGLTNGHGQKERGGDREGRSKGLSLAVTPGKANAV